MDDGLLLHKVGTGETYNSIASMMHQMYPNVFKTRDAAKDALIANNQIPRYMQKGCPQWGDYLNVSCRPNRTWLDDKSYIKSALGRVQPDVYEIMQQDPETVPYLLWSMQEARGAGWDIGAAEVSAALNSGGRQNSAWSGINVLKYGIAAADGAVGASHNHFKNIENLYKQMFKDAVNKLGKNTVLSKKPHNLQQLDAFIKGHPNYSKVQNILHSVPARVAQRFGCLKFTAEIQTARQFRHAIALPLEHPGALPYVNTAAVELAGISKKLVRVGTGATWILPTAIGLYEIGEAPPEEKFEKSMEVTGEVVVGAMLGFGAESIVAPALVAFLGISSGGLAFVIVALCVGGAAYAGGEIGKGVMSRLVKTLK